MNSASILSYRVTYGARFRASVKDFRGKMSKITNETPRRLKPQERRADLLNAAKKVLAESGWDKLTMIGVAEESGVTKRIVYNHFTTPHEIIEAIISSPMAEITAHSRNLSVAFKLGELSPREILQESLELTKRISPDGWFVLRAVYSRQLPSEFKSIETYAEGMIMDLWQPVFDTSLMSEVQKIAIMFYIYGAILDMAQLDLAGNLSTALRDEMFDRILGLLNFPE